MGLTAFAWLRWVVHVGGGAAGALAGALLLWPRKAFEQPAEEYWFNVALIGSTQGVCLGGIFFATTLLSELGRGMPRDGKRMAWDLVRSFLCGLFPIVAIPLFRLPS